MNRSNWIRIASLLAALAGAVGCGQKGALYLPDHDGSVVTRPANAPAPQPAPKKSADGQDDAPAPK